MGDCLGAPAAAGMDSENDADKIKSGPTGENVMCWFLPQAKRRLTNVTNNRGEQKSASLNLDTKKLPQKINISKFVETGQKLVRNDCEAGIGTEGVN